MGAAIIPADAQDDKIDIHKVEILTLFFPSLSILFAGQPGQ